MKETGKGKGRRESKELTGTDNLHLALQFLQKAAIGKEKKYKEKRMQIPGLTRHPDIQSLSLVLCRLPGLCHHPWSARQEPVSKPSAPHLGLYLFPQSPSA